MHFYYVFFILTAERRATILISPNARHLFQLSALAHKMQSLSGLSYTFTGNTSGKRHNFIWSSCFWIHLCTIHSPIADNSFPQFLSTFFLIFITELHTYKNILIFHRFTYDILSVPVMARSSSKYLGLENTQVNCILLSCLQTLWQPRSHWYLYKYGAFIWLSYICINLLNFYIPCELSSSV